MGCLYRRRWRSTRNLKVLRGAQSRHTDTAADADMLAATSSTWWEKLIRPARKRLRPPHPTQSPSSRSCLTLRPFPATTRKEAVPSSNARHLARYGGTYTDPRECFFVGMQSGAGCRASASIIPTRGSESRGEEPPSGEHVPPRLDPAAHCSHTVLMTCCALAFWLSRSRCTRCSTRNRRPLSSRTRPAGLLAALVRKHGESSERQGAEWGGGGVQDQNQRGRGRKGL